MINGVTLSVIFAVFQLTSIITLFVVSALIYAVLALIGYKTSANLSSWSPYITVFLIAGILLSVVNLFIGNSLLDIILDWFILILFMGITIYDINQVIAITFFAIQWSLIIIGILCKVLIKQKTTILHTILCCLLGWSGLVLLPILYNYNIIFFYYILAGGITYMLGIIFYALTFKYAHFVWHFFCIGGTILHFVAIYLYVL